MRCEFHHLGNFGANQQSAWPMILPVPCALSDEFCPSGTGKAGEGADCWCYIGYLYLAWVALAFLF